MANPFEGLFGQAGGGWGGLLDPRSQAMLGAAQALTQAGGPTRMPVSTGAALSGAMANASANYRQAQAAGMQQQMNKMKMQSQLMAMTQPTTDVKESNGRFVKVTTQPLYQMINGKLSRHPEAGKVSFDEGLNVGDPFKSRIGLLNTISKLAPKIQDGSATEAEKRDYAIAAHYLGKERLTTIPTAGGIQTIRDPGFDPTKIGLPPARADGLPPAAVGVHQAGSNVLGGRLSEGAAKAWLAHDSIKGTWDKYVRDLQNIGPKLFGADAKRMGSSYRAVFFALKDLAGLGVLSKSDEALLDKWLQDPTSWTAQYGRVDRDYLMADIDNISGMIERARQSMERIYGAQPKGTITAGPTVPPGMPPGSRPYVVNGVRQFSGDKEVWVDLTGGQWVKD